MCTPRKMFLLLAALLSLPWGQSHAQANLIASIPISGAERSSGGIWDTGTVTVTINGTPTSVSYGQFSTPASIASALGALISNECSLVSAQATGATLNFYGSSSADISISSTSNDPSLFASASFFPGLPPPDTNSPAYESWQNLECWGTSSTYPAYPENYTNHPKQGWQNYNYPNGTCLDQGTGTTSGGGGTFTCTQSNNVAGTGPCGSLETSNGPPSSMEPSGGTTELNVLDALEVCGSLTQYNCPSTAIGNMEDEVQFVIPQDTTYQALEFDPDVTWQASNYNNDPYSDKISVSCEFHPNDPTYNPSGNPEWLYWDSSANSWISFGNLGYSGSSGSYVPCSLSAGRHSLQLYATLDTANAQYTYQELIVDQQVLFDQAFGPINACNTTIQTGGHCYNFTPYIGVEQQVDNSTAHGYSSTCSSSSTQTVCAYYDNYNLVVW